MDYRSKLTFGLDIFAFLEQRNEPLWHFVLVSILAQLRSLQLAISNQFWNRTSHGQLTPRRFLTTGGEEDRCRELDSLAVVGT